MVFRTKYLKSWTLLSPSCKSPYKTYRLPATSVSSLIHLIFCKQISSLSSACNYHISDLCCISTLDLKTASVIAISLVHSKLGYCNSLYLNFLQEQISLLQLLKNSLAHAVTGTPQKLNIYNPVLKSLHWLKIEEHIHYKIISLTYDLTIFCNHNTSENLLLLLLNLLAPLVLSIILLYFTHLHLFLTYLIVHSTKPLLSSDIICQELWILSLTCYLILQPLGQCSALPLCLSKAQFRSHLKTYFLHHIPTLTFYPAWTDHIDLYPNSDVNRVLCTKEYIRLIWSPVFTGNI